MPASKLTQKAMWMVLCVALLGVGAYWGLRNRTPASGTGGGAVSVPSFTIPIGKVHPPLPYRIVSFHRGRADKNLIKLAAQLGFNGVQFQIEGSNVEGIKDFAARDAQEHLVDYCHSLNMQVTAWVHELSDLPGPWMPEYLGNVSLTNDKMWAELDARYEWILTQGIPNVDGLVLTVVETQTRVTSTEMMKKLVELVARKCKEHQKSLIVRTFVWHPEELTGVMGAVKELDKSTVIMSKAVPQDWQMRGGNAAEIGDVDGRPQIEEYDVAGEYFLRNNVANCMVDLLKKQFDYGMTKNIQGICVRADREDDNVLFQPNEVNLWALGMLAAGATDNVDDIWNQWATTRYGAKAAPYVIKALKPTSDVVSEMLSIGPFTDGDTRQFPALPDDFLLDKNWQNWRWNTSYKSMYDKINAGDAQVIAEIAAQKAVADKLADQSLIDIKEARDVLSDTEYNILWTRLLSNRVQLDFRTPMVMAALHFRQMVSSRTQAQWDGALDLYRKDLVKVKEVADKLGKNARATEVDYLGRKWELGVPLGVTREQLYKWAYDAERMLNYYW